MHISWQEVSARRLARSHLSGPRCPAGPARVSSAVVGVHAQVMSAAELSVGLRTEGCTRAQVRAALWSERCLVKTRGPRGTVHLIAADDLPMWTGALSAIPPGPSPFKPEVRLTAEQTDEVVAAIADAVESAAQELTVDELTEAIVARVGSWAAALVMPAFQVDWPRWRQAEAVATSRGVLCFGPLRGRHVTYTSPRRWLPGFRPDPPDQALPALLTSFLHAYGPATPAQFGRWLGAPVGWSAALFAGLEEALEAVTFEGAEAWQKAGEVPGGAAGPSLRLLPYFDAYVIGCHPRATLFPGRAGTRALTRGQAGNVPVLLIDGVVAGVWHQRRSGRAIAVTVEPFDDLSARQRSALAEEVDRIGVVLEGRARLTIGDVQIGAHA